VLPFVVQTKTPNHQTPKQKTKTPKVNQRPTGQPTASNQAAMPFSSKLFIQYTHHFPLFLKEFCFAMKALSFTEPNSLLKLRNQQSNSLKQSI
jgi:hypothetical protein